ncbi:MAG: hypothetical protein ABJH68_04920 [Ilumatobacter sp.]|uniref:hypothetical protein n=1 Tax=Ilumatobacter sp. TaxID=1967498 RepID=UPI003299ACFB
MPRSIQDILNHADQLAARFEIESPWVHRRLFTLDMKDRDEPFEEEHAAPVHA